MIEQVGAITIMLSIDDFRSIALAMPGAVERTHMGHPDFRVHDKIFATLQPVHGRGMVKLTPKQQHELTRQHPDAFATESGAWGRQGCTRVILDFVTEEVLVEAMSLACQNISNKGAQAPRRRRR